MLQIIVYLIILPIKVWFLYGGQKAGGGQVQGTVWRVKLTTDIVDKAKVVEINLVVTVGAVVETFLVVTPIVAEVNLGVVDGSRVLEIVTIEV